MGKDEETRKAAFQINSEKLERVAIALSAGDVSECLSPDVKHVCEVLARVNVLQDLAPGFLAEVFDLFIPHFIKMRNRAALEEAAQNRAEAGGFGDEWKRAIQAGKHPQQKDYLANMVALHMKVNAVSQSEAIRACAQQTNRDEDSVRRVVTRAKKRKK